MRRAGRLLVTLLVLFVSACAGTVRIARPGDFPFHSSDDKFFDLHWRLEKTPEQVRAVGLVEAARVDGVSKIVIELREIDADGKVVNHALGYAWGERLDRWDYRPFTASLRPKSLDDRFEPRVSSFSWAVGFGGH